MNAGLIILRAASERRDAQDEPDGARTAQLRRSSDSVAATSPSAFAAVSVVHLDLVHHYIYKILPTVLAV